MNNKLLLSLSTVLFLCLTALSAHAQDDEKGNAAKGQREFVQALDAAWVRVLRSGEYRAILNDPAYFAQPQGTPSTEHIVNQADCLPDPEVTDYPTGPLHGNFKKILEKGELNRCVVIGAPVPWDTTNFFRASTPIEDAVFAELESHYGVTLNRIDVPIPPPFDLTTALNDGTCDYINQVNALGGETEDLRRRNTRLFTCTLTSSGQFIHVPNSGGDRACVASGDCASAAELAAVQSIDDLQANPALNICTGNLSTQLSNQYFPDNNVNTIRFPGDIGNCAVNVLGEGYCACPPPFIPGPPCELRPSDNPGGVCPAGIDQEFDDLMIFSIPDVDEALKMGPFAGFVSQFRSVDTKIVAGTPLWVGIKPPPKK